MSKLFQEFQSFLDKGQIKLKNKNLNDIIKRYKYYFILTNDISNISTILTTILSQKSFYPIIFISEYLDNEHENNIGYDLFLICFESTLILVKQSEIQHFIKEIQRYISFTIYTKTDQTQKKIEKELNCHLPSSTEEEKDFFKKELTSFSIKFEIQIDAQSKKLAVIKNLYKLLFLEPIYGYLIKKGYYKTNSFDRVLNYKRFSKKIEDNSIDDDDYIKLRNLGKNNVFLIFHIKQEKLFTMKFYYEEKADVLFERERQNYLNIQHPLFPLYFGANVDKKAIVIEFINGKTLDQIKLNQNNKMKIIFQILVAMNYLHYNGYICRDLKPDNVMVINNYSIIIIDFDRMIADSDIYEFTKDFIHDFIAPEIQFDEPFSNEEDTETAGKNKTFSFKADIYSIGKIISTLFEDKFNLEELNSLKLIINECTSEDQSKRPNIQQLIKEFYINLFSKITPIDESNTIGLLSETHDDLFGIFCFYISECNHRISQFNLGLLHGPVKEMDIIFDINDYVISINKNKSDLQTLNKSVKAIRDINKLVDYLTLAANQNHLYAQFMLGLLYYKGEHISQNIEKSIHYLILAANQNIQSAQYILGQIYFSGKYITRDVNKAIHYFKLASNENNTKAQCKLGIIYYYGKYVEQDINKAIHYLKLAANQNDVKAQQVLGAIYYLGEYIEQDINKAIYYFALAANQSTPDSHYFLGEIYYEGKYINRDINKAIYYFTLAANQNNILAQCKLGEIYFMGEYISRDVKKSILFFELAANQNDVKAQHVLGVIYYFGVYIARNINKAIYYFALAAKQNEPDSQYSLGEIYSEGKYINRDINKAIYYFTLAANQNNVLAQYKLGEIYFKGEYISRDINKTIHYLTLASNQGDKRAQHDLGAIYYNGEFIPRDINKAIHYLTLASNQGDKRAQHDLGAIYYNGECIPQDINKAIYYFTLSSSTNIPDSNYLLGEIYSDGKYIAQDINKEIHYLKLASNQNDFRAQYILGIIYSDGKYITRDIKQGIYYLTLASDQNDAYAQYALGVIYFYGKYTERDIDKAIYYFSLAANQNIPDAQCALGEIFIDGRYVSKDINRAIHFFKLASKQNHKKALSVLGVIYYIGKHVSKNIDKGIHYLTLASNLNDPFAQHILGLIYFEHDINKAIDFFTLSATQNFPQSQFYLGSIYYEFNKNKSLNYYMTAAQNNDSKALFIIGCFYLTGKNVTKNINKAINYFLKSVNNGLNIGYFILGSIYFKGDEVDRDIDKSIYYYKESSSFNNNYSKNNLGIIYKYYYKKSYIDYFVEAIRQKNDYLSMYNLGHFYFYTEFVDKNLDKSIKLLYDSYKNGFNISLKLLCLAIYTKIKSFNIDDISTVIKNLGDNNKGICNEIFHFIQFFKSEPFYQIVYSYYKDIEFVYDYYLKPVVFNSFISNIKNEENEKEDQKIQYTLTKDFYEGFNNEF